MAITFEWVAGRLVHRRDDRSLTEASLALPRGAYTSFRTYGGNGVRWLSRHAERLRSSVDGGGTLGEEDLGAAIDGAIAAAGHPESRLRVTWAPPHLFVTIEPFVAPVEALYTSGAVCRTVAARRSRPRAKDTAFIATAADHYAQLPAGIHEGLIVDPDGSILEGLSSNVFFVHGGVLRTEEDRVLPGVTRELVLGLAADVLTIERRALTLAELPGATEAFITSASREVMPVVRIDDVVIGTGRPGAVSLELLARFRGEAARTGGPPTMPALRPGQAPGRGRPSAARSRGATAGRPPRSRGRRPR